MKLMVETWIGWLVDNDGNRTSLVWAKNEMNLGGLITMSCDSVE